MIVAGVLRSLALLSIALTSLKCHAIDNPDAPNYLEDFLFESSSYEQAIYEEAKTTSDSIEKYRDYLSFLEGKLAKVSAALNSKLSGSEQEVFNKSQSAWEAYQQAEKAFVSSVWKPQNFGSSYAMSRLAFYAEILRSRTELLLKYNLQL